MISHPQKSADVRWLEVGDSRDVNISIEKFPGRPRSIEPFLKRIGVKNDANGKKAE